jgi:hypothetical protein
MHSFDEDIVKVEAEIKSELEPFLNKILITPQEDLREFKKDYMRFANHCLDSLRILSLFTIETDVKALPTSIKEQIFLLYQYLGMVESLGNCIVDILVMLLVANKRDFHIESMQTPRIRHVYSLDDLEKAKVPLTMKLNFLRDNGIKTYPSIIDSKLRNDIAHFNFKIENNKVAIRGKDVWEVVYPNNRKIQAATQTVVELFNNLKKNLGW